jgi:hypothetical protein
LKVNTMLKVELDEENGIATLIPDSALSGQDFEYA